MGKPAVAQQCIATIEKIITLREPIYKTPMVWTASYGEYGLDRVKDMVLAHQKDEGEDLLIVGNYTFDKNDEVIHPFVALLGARGKAVWETRSKSSYEQTAEHVLKTKKGYAVLGNIKHPKKGNGFYFALYSKDGKRVKQRPVFASDANVMGKGFVETKDGKGFLIAVERVSKTDEEKRDAVLYRINKDGTFVWSRKYSPGLQTVFTGIHRLFDGRYMLTGKIEQEEGRMAAWLMSVEEDGAIGWQRQYPRGSGAMLHSIVLLKDKSMVAIGTVKPFRGDKQSAWVMKMDSSGAPLWQRYYSGAYRYEARGIVAEDDGRFSIMLNAAPTRGKRKGKLRPRGHVRLIVLSPRGFLMDVESYSDSRHAGGMTYIKSRKGKRIVAGDQQGSIPDGTDPTHLVGSVFNGWIFSATTLDPYEDPCNGGY